jgi:GMP reductase
MPKIEEGLKLDFHNVLIRPKRSTINSRSNVNLIRTIKFKNCKSLKSWEGIPIIASNMDTVGTFDVYKTLSKFKIITAMHKFYTVADFILYQSDNNIVLNPDLFMVSTGIQETDFTRLNSILSVISCNWICIDVANGYIESLVHFCKRVREKYPDKIIVAGNVVTREIVEELILNGGVDVVKVGIGPGSACLTRMKTGVGMPQLSAIMECADAAHGVGGHIIGDGGITCPGDMAKAFGGGADFVMVGGAFSGHDENPGEIITNIDGSQSKLFYGMSSSHAMSKHYGGMNDYRASEGRIIRVPSRGLLEHTVLDYLGGLRSTCTYINASCIKHIPLCTTFVQVSQQLNTSLI